MRIEKKSIRSWKICRKIFANIAIAIILGINRYFQRRKRLEFKVTVEKITEDFRT